MQYMARQPIVDAHRHAVAFELLFRNSLENFSPGGDPDTASKKTMDAAVLLGLDILSGGNKLFLNCPTEFLVEAYVTLFPPELTVIEVLETVEASPAVLSACRNLKALGYQIALDDFVPQPGCEELVELADVIKIDVQSTPQAGWTRMADRYLASGRQLLAEKVETEAEFDLTRDVGFTLFQGYLFSKPQVLAAASVDGLEVNHFRVLRLLSRPGDLNMVEVESVIKSDPALCYRFLRYLKSPAFYFQSEIRSILHALILLGEEEVRKWLLVVSAAVEEVETPQKPRVQAALVRARFAELMGAETKLPNTNLFLLGLLSSLMSLLDLPAVTVAEQIALPSELRAALLGTQNRYRSCLDLVVAYEQAEWQKCERIRGEWQLSPQTLNRAYIDATQWARDIVQS
jgi:c-di-GMP-related signal transduction protein